MPDLHLTGVEQVFPGDPPVAALRGVDLTVRQGEFVAIEGASGSGKSTLLNNLGLLHVPTRGDYRLDETSVVASSSTERARLRSRSIAFIFQAFHLLDARPVIDSVELGLLYRGVRRGERRRRALAALDAVGLGEKAWQRARNLSGGERQRVAIARAIATDAPVVLADEPTGNLDSANGAVVVQTLATLAESGRTVVVVTHDHGVAQTARRQVMMRDGVVVSDSGAPAGDPAPAPQAERIGRDSRLRGADLLRDVIATLAASAGRTASLVAAVAVAVALAVSTLALSSTAQAQVSERFDANLATLVTVSDAAAASLPVDPFAPADLRSTTDAMLTIAGVRAAACVVPHSQISVSLPGRPLAPATANAVEVTGDLRSTTGMTIDWAPGHSGTLGAGEVVLGQNLADALQLGPLTPTPAVQISAQTFAVVGIAPIDSLLAEAGSGVLISPGSLHLSTEATRCYLRTQAGAAAQAAVQAPLILRPTAPESVSAPPPPDPDTLRAAIQNDVRSALVVLTIVALGASVVGLGNAMVMSVLQRAHELGLRRALGARPRHIVGQVLTEAAVIGLVGGAVGLIVAMAGVLGVTIARHWTPVFDPRLAVAAIVGGVVVGSLGGAAAAIRAARVQPADALRT